MFSSVRQVALQNIGSVKLGPLALDDAQIELMRRIKAAFDPDHILNPGKVFPPA
jgi:FAD/FMN-containing dehydrogenase